MAQMDQTTSRVGHGFDEVKPTKKEIFSKFFLESEARARPASVTIGKSCEEVFRFFRDFANHPLFMKDLKQVTTLSPKASHWVFQHGETRHECEVEVLAEEPGQMVAWKILTTTASQPIGVATFEKAPGNRGTVVTIKTSGESAPGKISGVLSYFFGHEPKTQSAIYLRRLKAFLETGEVPTIEGQPNGKDETNLGKQQ